MRSTQLNFLLGAFCVLPAMLSISLPGCAQARSTASRSTDVAAFGGYAGARTDYGVYKDQGEAIGLDFSHYFRHFPIVPSLEARTNLVHGSFINERTYLFGGRAELPLHRLHPYVDTLIGLGTLHYANPPAPGYTSDRSKVYSYGGGLDVNLVYNFQLKIDAQYQTWNLGPFDPNVPQDGYFTLTPAVGIVGVEYHIPFRPHSRQQDFHH
jgi:hypothetical protein